MYGKGKNKGYGGYSRGYGYETSQFYTPPQSCPDRLPGVAEKLVQVKNNLSEDATKAYQALQIALQRHSDPHGASSVNFEKMFYDCLSAVFPEAWDVQARQIGGQNQWEVTVDGGPPMYCSVRLEVLSEDAEFLRNLKDKARVVKDTLLEDEGRWKRTLQPEYGLLSMDKLSQFEEECNARCARDGYGNSRYGRNNHQWVERGSRCQICGRSKDDDLLNGQHMCVVCATFQCTDCRYSWTSHHGRLKPDGSTLMGQQCMKCRGRGVSVEWRVVNRQEREYDQDRGPSERNKGAHQNELCDACREFGNCTGVFYDPFILTTALQIVSGSDVTWKAFNADMPELLVADMPTYPDLQVVLQPHVYVPSDDSRERYGTAGYGGYGGRNGNRGGDYGYASDRGYEPERPPMRRAGGGKGDGGKGWQGTDNYSSYVAPPLRSSDRPTGGVKDEAAFQRYLSRPAQGGPSGAANLAPPAPRPSKGKGKSEEPPRQEVYAGSMASSAGAAGAAPEADGPPTLKPNNKFNKMGGGGGMGGGDPGTGPATQKTSSTPRLDLLPPLRRAQFLQVVQRQVKSSGKQTEKQELAEEYLALCNGDYDEAYQYVKQLGENSATLQ